MKKRTPEASLKFIPLHRLQKFVQRRNKASYHHNMAFQNDAHVCNINLDLLGDVRKFIVDRFPGYEWNVQVEDKKVRMVEFGHTLYLDTGYDYETTSMFKLMQKAEYPVEPKQTEAVLS